MADQDSLDRWIDLTRAWASLTSRDREVLALTAFEGIGPDAGAVVLGIRRTTFSMRLARARKRLEAALGDGAPHYRPLTAAVTVTADDILLSERRGDSGLTIMRTAWWPGGSGGEVKDQNTVTVHTGATSTTYLMVETYTDPE